MIKVINLSKKFDQKNILNNLNLVLNDTGILFIHGESGSGKSTFINACLGLIDFDGEININDNVFNKENKMVSNFRLENFSYCGELNNVFTNKSLKENLENLNKFDNKKLSKLLKELNFREINKPLYLLSGGNKKKAKIIYAILKESPILVLDEPFAFVDTTSKDNLVNIINEEAKKRLVIIVSHELFERLDINYKLELPNQKFEIIKENGDEISINSNINNKKIAKSIHKQIRFKNKWLIVLNTIISFLFMLSLMITITVFKPSELRDPLKYSVKNDPYNRFIAQLDESYNYNEFEKLKKYDNFIYKVTSYFFVAVLDDERIIDNTIYNFEKSLNKINPDGQNFIQDGNNRVFLDVKDLPSEILDFRYPSSFGFYVISNNTFNLIMKNGGFSSLKTNIHFENFPLFNYNSNKLFIETSYGIDVTIIDSQDMLLGIENVGLGEEIDVIKDDEKIISLKTNLESNNGVLISRNLYEYLLGTQPFGFSYILTKDEIINNNTKFNVEFIIHDYFAEVHSFGVIFLIITIFLLILNIGFIFYSLYYNQKKNIVSKYLSLLNGQSSFEYYKIVGINYIVPCLPLIVINLLLYLMLFIPKINYKFFEKYNFDYYSHFNDELYKNIEMLNFQTFSNLSLLLFVPIIIILIVYFIGYLIDKKEK